MFGRMSKKLKFYNLAFYVVKYLRNICTHFPCNLRQDPMVGFQFFFTSFFIVTLKMVVLKYVQWNIVKEL
jgi:hypothetical protein